MRQTKQVSDLLLGLLFASIAIAIFAAVILSTPSKFENKPRVSLDKNEITVTIADTPALRSKGLSGQIELKDNEGMLFNFPLPGNYGFWMKDMFFPIDIIWFDSGRRVVDVWENATPDSYPKIYTPSMPAQFVLEVRAGYFAGHHLKVGNILGIPK